MRKLLSAVLALELVLLGTAWAQASSGAIVGFVADPTGAAISGVHIAVTNKNTGVRRAVVTAAAGDYSASALEVGLYEVSAEA